MLTRSAGRPRLALDLGATSAGDAYDAPPEPLDAAILFAPVGDLVPVALAALDRGGTLAVAGIHLTDIPPLNYQRHLFQERTLRSVTANTRADGEEFLAFAARTACAVDDDAVPTRRAPTTRWPTSPPTGSTAPRCSSRDPEVPGGRGLIAKPPQRDGPLWTSLSPPGAWCRVACTGRPQRSTMTTSATGRRGVGGPGTPCPARSRIFGDPYRRSPTRSSSATAGTSIGCDINDVTRPAWSR